MAYSPAYFARAAMDARLNHDLADAAGAISGGLNAETLRAHLQPALKRWMSAERAALQAYFFEHLQGTRCMRWLADGMDVLVQGLAQWVAQYVLPEGEALSWCLLATGGYGRRELFPYSDVDVLVLLPENPTPLQEEALQAMLYMLWDAGLKVGHRVVSVEEGLQHAWSDLHFLTSLLDARPIAGDASLGAAFKEQFAAGLAERSVLQFVEDKLAERDERHQRVGDSRFILQPHIKDAKGGLRDLHTLYWLARRAYGVERVAELAARGLMTTQEYRAYWRSAQFLSTVRMALHFLAGRAEERLSFDMQRQIAQALGYRGTPNQSVERFMKRYFQVATAIGHLTRSFCAVLEDDKKRKPMALLERVKAKTEDLHGFKLEGERLVFATEDEPAETPYRMIELFNVARMTNRDTHPSAIRAVSLSLKKFDHKARKHPRAVAAFWDILLSPQAELYLKKMNEAGLLARMIPAFGRLSGQMQFDMYHTYTVDEHILVAIGILHQIAAGKFVHILPQTSSVILHFKQNKALYLAMLCHDIGKGRGGNHPQIGAQIGRKLAADLGLDKADQELVSWLVEHHQLLTDIAFKRDVQDMQVWQAAAAQIQSLQKLRMLLLMTVADVHAVGPHVWNQWKGSVLRQLYRGVERVLSQGEVGMDEEERAPELSSPDQDALLAARVRRDFWVSVPKVQRMTMARALVDDPQDMKTRCIWDNDSEGDVAILSVLTPDKPALFTLLSGVISASQANIVSCRVRTLKDGMAVDTFWLQDRDGHAYSDKNRQKRLEKLLLDTLENPDVLEREMKRVQQDYGRHKTTMDVPTKIYFAQDASQDATVLEVSTADRIGLLYTIARILAHQYVSIHAAHIVTYGPQAVDVFYIKDRYGMKIEHPARLQVIEEALLQALTSPATLMKAS